MRQPLKVHHMQSLSELIAQREALDKQIQAARQLENADAIASIHKLIEQFGLTALDIFPSKKGSSKAAKKVAPKFKNPATGDTWTGRGKPPKWIAGQDREQYLIR